MLKGRRLSRLHRWALCGSTGLLLAFPFGGCSFGEFTTTSSVTLSGRDVLTFLLRSFVVDPFVQAVDLGIDRLFDRIEGQE
ncbi:MAG: hypothetical protein IPM18_08450 [Phycisphaerales bacterium]|nr:hypothetical protein [Phycisphaerales bacterium]